MRSKILAPMPHSSPLPSPRSPPAHSWHCGRFRIDVSRPRIMGVVNVTPDSFSDGGRFFDPQRAIAQAQRLIEEGADLVDVGGESTRPGAKEVDAPEELRRVLPVLRALRDAAVPVAIDTVKPQVMQVAIAEGVAIINDVSALRAAGALQAVAGRDVGVCLMHMQGEPRSMQEAPAYANVVEEVRRFLTERIDAATGAGMARERIVIDPGFGFGKTVEHNLELLRGLGRFAELGVPLLVGLSRKSLLGAITGRPAADRLAPSIAAALLAAQHGAKILRVHDVRETRDALAVWQALRNA